MKIFALLFSAALADSCGDKYKSQSACDGDSTCTWCKCAALPSACWTKANAKSLPSGVYQCDSSDTISDEILLVDFKGSDKAVTHEWRANNDPVMGGQSYSTVKVENNILNFTGACKIVPKLKAPGFITAVNSDHNSWVDISSCEGLKIMHKSANDYAGFRVSFGHAHPKGGGFFAYGYKSHFSPSVGSFGAASIPFHNFTDFWDDGSGKPIHTCQENEEYCPDAKTLKDMETMSIWAEGVEGDISLEIESISGYGCK
jgi:hypothetical protein